MRVQFIFPNFDCPLGISIGISYLSAGLKRERHETSVIHINEELGNPFDADQIVSKVACFDPHLIAIGTGDNHYPEMAILSRMLKDRLDTPVLFGGIHPTLNAQVVLSDSPWIDYVNVGEGDDSILDLVRALQASADTTSIPNIWTRQGNQIIKNAMRPLKDISFMPWMDLDIWDFQKITQLRRGWVNISMNRGCPYRCTYCHNNGVAEGLRRDFGARTGDNESLGYLRFRDVGDMIGELKSICSLYPCVTAFSFIDDTFTMNRDHTEAFLAAYKAEIDLPFVCNTTVLDVDRGLLEIMKEAKCDLVRFGVEVASSRIGRNILKRNFSSDARDAAFRTCEEIGLRSFAYTIIANPTETIEEMADTLALNAGLRPDGVRVALGYPYPGTEYHKIAQEANLIDSTRHLHNYLEDTKLLWPVEDRVRIDKLRSLYWWWMNAHLDSGASPIFAQLVNAVEGITADLWYSTEMQGTLRDLDAALSRLLNNLQVPHYHTPFQERPDIAILARFRQTFLAEYLDEH